MVDTYLSLFLLKKCKNVKGWQMNRLVFLVRFMNKKVVVNEEMTNLKAQHESLVKYF